MSESDMTVRELKTSIDKQFEHVDYRLNKIEDRLYTIEKDILGLGNEKPGIGFRLDRLEKLKNWILIVAAIVVTALLGGCFAHYFELLGK